MRVSVVADRSDRVVRTVGSGWDGPAGAQVAVGAEAAPRAEPIERVRARARDDDEADLRDDIEATSDSASFAP